MDHLDGLDGISDAQIAAHLRPDAGDVKPVNAPGEELAVLRRRGQAAGARPEFAEPRRRPGFESGALARALDRDVGSLEPWMTASQAGGEMRGIGWVILFEDPVTDRLCDDRVTMHSGGIPAGFKPLLVMDVWEHAYMHDCQASERKPDVEALVRSIAGARSSGR